MANGDAAVAAGMAKVLSTDKRGMGYDQDNLTRDYIAQRTTRAFLDIYVQTAAPTGGPVLGRVWIHPQ